ncbi:MAG TPA: NUDIX hydrolase [Rhodospirillales bacterium]|nr:NUDIX hydrolase [Rhodospirillales bacterium]
MSREYPDRPLVGVGAVVLRGGEVLLIRRARPPLQGEWSLPGGLQKLGETVFAAAAREVREETGVAIRPLGIIDVVDLIEHDAESAAGRVRWHYTLIDVLAAWSGGEPRAAADAAEAVWAKVEDIADFVRSGETARIVRKAYDTWRTIDDTKG